MDIFGLIVVGVMTPKTELETMVPFPEQAFYKITGLNYNQSFSYIILGSNPGLFSAKVTSN